MEKTNALSGWKKIITTGVAFVGIVIGMIFDVDTEKLVFLATPLLLTIVEGALDFRSRGNGK